MTDGKFKSKKSKSSRAKASKARYTKRSRGYARNTAGSTLVGLRKTTINFQRSALPFSKNSGNSLPYAESSSITANGTNGIAYGTYTYNLTGPYDPRIQALGGQPIQWDIVSPQYERYQVLGCYFYITFSNPSHDGMFVGYRVRGSTNSIEVYSKTIDQIKEMELTQSRFINNTGKQVVTFKGYVKPWVILGLNKFQYFDAVYSAQTTSIPTVNVILEPFALHTVSGEESATIRCTVSLRYLVKFTNKITVLDA